MKSNEQVPMYTYTSLKEQILWFKNFLNSPASDLPQDYIDLFQNIDFTNISLDNMEDIRDKINRLHVGYYDYLDSSYRLLNIKCHTCGNSVKRAIEIVGYNEKFELCEVCLDKMIKKFD